MCEQNITIINNKHNNIWPFTKAELQNHSSVRTSFANVYLLLPLDGIPSNFKGLNCRGVGVNSIVKPEICRMNMFYDQSW